MSEKTTIPFAEMKAEMDAILDACDTGKHGNAAEYWTNGEVIAHLVKVAGVPRTERVHVEHQVIHAMSVPAAQRRASDLVRAILTVMDAIDPTAEPYKEN